MVQEIDQVPWLELRVKRPWPAPMTPTQTQPRMRSGRHVYGAPMVFDSPSRPAIVALIALDSVFIDTLA